MGMEVGALQSFTSIPKERWLRAEDRVINF
jgi:hypothetical protein